MSKRTNNCILVDFDNLAENTLCIKSTNLSKVKLNFENVNHCPICYTAISPDLQASIAFNAFAEEYNPQIVLINKCPECDSFFVVGYNAKCDGAREHFEAEIENISFIAPQSFVVASFNESIYNISKRFIKIYNQALQAESLGLDEISGMGFRKALEILVKDYIKYIQPDISENIESKSLSNCIKDNIDNARIKELAEKAAWLGNDEAHYVQYFTNQDVPSIKELIGAMIHFIDSDLIFNKAKSIQHKNTFKKNVH